MARKKESIFWDAVRPLLAGLHPVRIENAASAGTPDVNITLGWIELKQVEAKDIPKRPDTILRIEHFTPEQRIFLLKRSRAGAACWLLLLLDHEWLLYTGNNAAMLLGKLNVAKTRDLACRSWSAPPDKDILQTALRETAFCMVLDGAKA